MGQLLDTTTSANQESGRYDLSTFSLKKYRTIVVYKTAFYSFYLPVAMGMLLCGIRMPSPYCSVRSTANPYKQALDILLPMGEYFQVQDDYLDAFGSPEVLGKIGTDIIDGKCSWCACMALSLATPEQRQVIDRNYGSGVVGATQELCVKEVYKQVGLRGQYTEYEEAFKCQFYSAIDGVDDSGQMKKEVFTRFFDKIYKRYK
jgi:farnesyl diphosphate synthase